MRFTTSPVFVALIAAYIGHVIDLHNQVFVNYSDVWITFADLSVWSLIPALRLSTLLCHMKFVPENSPYGIPPRGSSDVIPQSLRL
jgi:hypothetical protein